MKKEPKKMKQFKRDLGPHETYNICLIGIPEGEEKDQGIKNLFEKIMAENFPNIVKRKVM